MRASCPPHRVARRSGFVLLLVLASLVFVTIALSSLAQMSLRMGVAALQAQEALQRRWGMITIQRALLPAAGGLFHQREKLLETTGEPLPGAPVLQGSLMLGRQRFELLLADEDAKANLNAIYHASGQADTEGALRRLLGPLGVLAVALRPEVPSSAPLRQRAAPMDDEDTDVEPPAPPPAFQSWGEVFDFTQLRSNSVSDRDLAGLTRQFTCWGSGRLNVRRAGDEAVLAVCRPVVEDGLARRLLDRYRETPDYDLRVLIEKEVIDPRKRAQLLEILGDSSSSFSLWIEASSERFRQQHFAIRRPVAEGITRTVEFSW